MNCQIEFVPSDSDNGMPCGKSVVTKCSDCEEAGSKRTPSINGAWPIDPTTAK